ncbi:hypothetical protein GUJ93_ZPchr0019g2685 [Zizania palustris]|uniref:Uncharacterized protein n=1 Tax=Zizania palustris TaxID=103762 RepID=A0A8J5W5K5_ZIZPA|nr:hypothetical protein GUJ93_ZPchr0019g2685 [Zizania palustris]
MACPPLPPTRAVCASSSRDTVCPHNDAAAAADGKIQWNWSFRPMSPVAFLAHSRNILPSASLSPLCSSRNKMSARLKLQSLKSYVFFKKNLYRNCQKIVLKLFVMFLIEPNCPMFYFERDSHA